MTYRLITIATATLIAVMGTLNDARANPEWDTIVAYVDASYTTTDPETGKQKTVSNVGSGYVVSTQGHIATAYHVIEAWDTLSQKDKDRNPITVRFVRSASDRRNNYEARSIIIREPEDEFAVLQITEPFEAEAIATACLLNTPQGEPLTAAGYPAAVGAERSYTPVSFGSGDSGKWTVTSDFARGMSGGPVFWRGTLKVVGFVTSGSLSNPTVRHVTPTASVAAEFAYVVGTRPLDCRDTPRLAGTGSYVLTVWRQQTRVERCIQRHDLGGFKGRNKEIDRFVRPTPGWAIDTDESRRDTFKLIIGAADNGRCAGWRWNTLSSESVVMYVRVDQTKHLIPKDARVNCSAEIPEFSEIQETLEDVPVEATIPFDNDTVIELPAGAMDWRLEIRNPRGKRLECPH